MASSLRLPARVHYTPAMQFDEIARELHTTPKAVFQLYVSAMRKIAARQYSLRQLALAVGQMQARRSEGISRRRPQAE